MAARGEGPSVRVAQIEVIDSYQRFRLMGSPWLGKRERKGNSGKAAVNSARAGAWAVSRKSSLRKSLSSGVRAEKPSFSKGSKEWNGRGPTRWA
jgi:hypothetical protein